MPYGYSLDSSTDAKFRRSCVRTFDAYNRKDQIKGILRNDQASIPPSLRPFTQDKVGFTTLGHVLTLAKVTATPLMALDQARKIHASDRVENITKIQTWWRAANRALVINRAKASTREGRCTTQLIGLCNKFFATLPTARLTNGAKIHTRSIIFTDILQLLLTIDEVSTRLRALRDQWKWEFELKHTVTGV